MSSQRGRATYHAQNQRQEWVPRGPPSGIGHPTSSNISVNDGRGDSVCNVHSTRVLPRSQDSHLKGNVPRGEKRYQPSWRRGNKLRGRDAVKQPQNEDKRVSRNSDLPQLVQEIQENLLKGSIECMICYDMVRRSAPIWSCTSCYSIFHLSCIKKWARAPTSIDLSAEKSQGLNWRCPGCQAVQLTEAREIQYACFCGKRTDPPSDLYLVPHSCGEPCGKQLEKGVLNSLSSIEDRCPHHCVLQCHPGPCPPCKSFAPSRLCPCGKRMITKRCSERESAISCGQVCNKVLNCSRHRCRKPCHIGECDPCDVLINAVCYCKKKVEAIRCYTVPVDRELNIGHGMFSCSSVCGKNLTCGNHTCSEVCHMGRCAGCDLMPSKILSCYCGKTALSEKRHSCLDPIPTCSEICGKKLPCGIHCCNELCHEGDCALCLVPVRQNCRCGSTSRTIECYKTMTGGEMFICEKACGRKKSCGRHRCSERCCSVSSVKSSIDADRNPHLCSMVCGKRLRCGQHSCDSFCHSGHCPPCLETIFTDLTCACGRTSIPPPIPCGTPSPSCQYPCLIAQPCGHPAGHSCHFGDCPPCSVPVAKECIGGHVIIRNIPCGSREIRCNKVCGKNRQCGMHKCGRPCHPPPCESDVVGIAASCGQTCGVLRRDCQHTCTALCHPSSSCPDSRCDFSLTISCSCGRITATVPCDAGGASSGYADNVFEASVAQKLPVPLKPTEVTGKRIPLGQRKLMCDEECARFERKRVLADAFDITHPNMDALNLDDNSAFSEIMTDLFRREPKFVLAVEERCRFLVVNKTRGVLRLHVFYPMVKEKRDAVRVIADRWKLSVNSAGWEPKRFVVISVAPKSKPPVRALMKNAAMLTSPSHPPPFDHVIDMDPRVIVVLQDLPNDADISALVLRFGGECELVWLNDRNALAVFGNPVRASTAMRRLEHVSAYQGACSMNASVGASGLREIAGKSENTTGAASAWKRAVVQDQSLNQSWWDGEELPVGRSDVQTGGGMETLIDISANPWSVLDGEVDSSKGTIAAATETPSASCLPPTQAPPGGDGIVNEVDEVVDDWENAYK